MGPKQIYKAFREEYYRNKRKPYLKDINTILNVNNLSIISNNCIAGRIYQDINQSYNTPTAGLYFMFPDFNEFLSNLEYYIKAPLIFVNQSKYELGNKRLKEAKHYYPVALLDGKVEIHFLHYKSEEEAKIKWERRCERINLDNIIIIGSEQNNCYAKDMQDFDKLLFKRKIFFSTKKIEGENIVYVPEFASLVEAGNPFTKADIYYKYLIDFAKKNNW